MPNPVLITSQRINNSASTTIVSTFVQADVRALGTGTGNAAVPDYDKMFLPVIGGSGDLKA